MNRRAALAVSLSVNRAAMPPVTCPATLHVMLPVMPFARHHVKHAPNSHWKIAVQDPTTNRSSVVQSNTAKAVGQRKMAPHRAINAQTVRRQKATVPAPQRLMMHHATHRPLARMFAKTGLTSMHDQRHRTAKIAATLATLKPIKVKDAHHTHDLASHLVQANRRALANLLVQAPVQDNLGQAVLAAPVKFGKSDLVA